MSLLLTQIFLRSVWHCIVIPARIHAEGSVRLLLRKIDGDKQVGAAGSEGGWMVNSNESLSREGVVVVVGGVGGGGYGSSFSGDT